MKFPVALWKLFPKLEPWLTTSEAEPLLSSPPMILVAAGVVSVSPAGSIVRTTVVAELRSALTVNSPPGASRRPARRPLRLH